jgi:hypothetical protein
MAGILIKSLQTRLTIAPVSSASLITTCEVLGACGRLPNLRKQVILGSQEPKTAFIPVSVRSFCLETA